MPERQSPWTSFEQSDDYEIVDLGRPAVFFVPSHKLNQISESGDSFGSLLDGFLYENFGGFTTSMVPMRGQWLGEGQISYVDESRMYEVAFLGTEPIGQLMSFLADLAEAIEEEALYFKAGEDACLIKPVID